jgi:hypothetical protein
VHKDGRILEATALFDTGSRRSYFSRESLKKSDMSPIKSLRKFH